MNDTTMHDDLIADSVNRLFAEQVDKAARDRAEAGGWDQRLWGLVADGGFPMLTATEVGGGLGQGWDTAFSVLRGLGHWQVPLPLAETMVAASLASTAGLEIPGGGAAPLGILELGRAVGVASTAGARRAAPAVQVQADAQGLSLSGTVHHVPWARHARALLVSLPADVASGRAAGLAWLGAEAAGGLGGDPAIRIQPGQDIARMPSDTLVLEHARLSALAPNPLSLDEPVWHLGAMARSAMMVGALESALQMAVQYAGERVQFGKPIGKFQAVQQNLALMAGDVAAARVAALVACQDAPSPLQPQAPSAAFSIAVAKVRAGEAATRGASIAHQVHGAIGFTLEHALHFATRRLWSWREDFGTDAEWAGVLGRAAIAARAQNFWPAMTQRRFD